MGADGPTAADVVNGMERARSRPRHRRSRRGEAGAAGRRGDRPGARAKSRSTDTAELAEIVAERRRPAAAPTRSIRRPARSRRCASSSIASSTSSPRRSPPPSACSARAAGWSSSPSIRSRTASSSASSPSAPAERPRRLAPSPEATCAPPTFELLTRGAVAPGEAEIARQSARPFGAAARRAPHRRAGACRSTRRAIGVPALPEFGLGRVVTMGRIVNVVLVVADDRRRGRHLRHEARGRDGRATRVARLQAEIAKEKEPIALLKAEWSVLTQPARLQERRSTSMPIISSCSRSPPTRSRPSTRFRCKPVAPEPDAGRGDHRRHRRRRRPIRIGPER